MEGGITLGLPIEKVNLPDLNKAKSKSSLLRPLPTEQIMAFLKRFLQEEGYHPNEEMKSLDPLHRMIVVVREQLLKFSFRDWRYSLTDIYNWGNREELTIELFAERKNMHMKLTVNKFKITDWEMREYASDPSPEKPNMTIIDGARLLLEFFNNCNCNIEEWDNICMNHKPLIVEEPPFTSLFEFFMERFHENAREDYYELKEEGFFNSFKQYQLEREYYPTELLDTEMYDINYELWEFGPHTMFVEFEELGADLYYGYLMFNVYIKTGRVGITYLMDSLEISKGDQFYYDEVETLFSQFEYDLYGAARQWNQILEG